MTGTDGAPVVVITGAASGIGRSCAEHLATAGFRVVGGDIRTDGDPLAYGVEVRHLDVDDDLSCSSFVDGVVHDRGRIDVLFNNAGFGIAGPAEETSSDEAHAQLETSFFGLARMCRLVLPHMRELGRGLIVNMSSIGGLIALPYQSLYSAAKFAVEGYSEALRFEVRPFGIDVALIEPSDFRTGFTDRRRIVKGTGVSSPYWSEFQRVLGVARNDELAGSDPAQVALLLERIIRADRRRFRYTVGDPMVRITPLLKRALPWAMSERIVRSYWGRG
jgi:NAD(P)-dependent dehydrogenase (short-subunit alcohol dehydrogenase family)